MSENKIIMYKVFTEDHGDNITLSPQIPKTPMKNENTTIPRIPVAPTILQCLNAIDIPERICESGKSKIPVYVYATWITDKSVVQQPFSDKVPDQWISGELWIRNICPFTKVCNGYVAKQFDFPNVAYSRYCFYAYEDIAPLDIITAPAVYGEEFGFSFIEIDPTRIDSAIEYANNNPYIP